MIVIQDNANIYLVRIFSACIVYEITYRENTLEAINFYKKEEHFYFYISHKEIKCMSD